MEWCRQKRGSEFLKDSSSEIMIKEKRGMTQTNSSSYSKSWVFFNSIWLIFLFTPLGLGTFASFFFIGIRANVKKWIYAGIVYLILVITGFILINYFDDEHILTDIGVGFIMGAWLTAIGHGFSVRSKYLQIIALQKQERNLAKVEQENVSIVTAAEIKDNKKSSKKKAKLTESEPNVINMNRATEKEISQLPSIHPFLAKEIIKIRKKVKKFESLEHFARMTNVKPHILARSKKYMKFTDIDVKTARRKSDEDINQSKSNRKGRIVDY